MAPARLPRPRGVVEKLSAELPCYRLPPAFGAHSRHYMPIGVLDGETRREKTTLVFDTWARLDDGELTATWKDMCLDQAEMSILDDLVQCLNYLGRSESWVEGRVMREGEPEPKANCFPDRRGEMPDRVGSRLPFSRLQSLPTFRLGG